MLSNNVTFKFVQVNKTVILISDLHGLLQLFALYNLFSIRSGVCLHMRVYLSAYISMYIYYLCVYIYVSMCHFCIYDVSVCNKSMVCFGAPCNKIRMDESERERERERRIQWSKY